MIKFKKIFVFIILICLLFTTSIGCQSSTDANSSNKESTEPLIIKLSGGDYGEPSPYQHYPRGPGIYKMRLVFDSLLERDENGLIPWLAKSWSIEDEGKTYIFTLQDNIKWNDGEALTAEDVKFSFEYFIKNPPIDNSLLINGKPFIEKIEVLSINQVKITVVEPNATILQYIGRSVIIPKHIWENVEDPNSFRSDLAVVGSGPYKIEEYNKELGSYKFVAFKDFWGPKQSVDEIHFIPVSDETLAFDQGQIDVANISPDVLPKYKNDSQYNIIQQPAFWGYRLIFNLNKEKGFNNKNVRQAIAYAIDIDDIIKKVERGAAVPASAGYLPIDHIWYNNDVKKYNYDIERAKQLIGNNTFSFELLTGNSTKEVRIAELIQLYLKEIGINVKIISVDTKTRDAAVKKGDYQAVIYGHGGWGADPDSLRIIYANEELVNASPSTSNIPGYYNAEINNLGLKQLYALDDNYRKELIFELQELISEELPMLPLYNTTGYDVYKPSKYDGWINMYDHHLITHSKFSYLERN